PGPQPPRARALPRRRRPSPAPPGEPVVGHARRLDASRDSRGRGTAAAAAGARAARGAGPHARPALDHAHGRAALRGDATDVGPAGRRAARTRRAPRSRGAAPRAARAPGLTPATARGRPADLVVRGPALRSERVSAYGS